MFIIFIHLKFSYILLYLFQIHACDYKDYIQFFYSKCLYANLEQFHIKKKFKIKYVFSFKRFKTIKNILLDFKSGIYAVLF